MPAHYAVRYNRNGVGRKDILSLGEPDTPAPYLRVEIYRPGGEIARFAEPVAAIATAAPALGPDHVARGEPLDSKFGPLSIVTFDTRRACRAIASASCAAMTIRCCNCPAGSAAAANSIAALDACPARSTG